MFVWRVETCVFALIDNQFYSIFEEHVISSKKKIVWRGVDEDEVAVLPVQITKQIFVYTYV